MFITKKMLRDKQACEDQVEIFAAEWPDGVELSPKSLGRALELGLDTGWFMLSFFWSVSRTKIREGIPLHFYHNAALAWLYAGKSYAEKGQEMFDALAPYLFPDDETFAELGSSLAAFGREMSDALAPYLDEEV